MLPRQFGKYTLVRQLATGGMAELYLAIQRAVAGFEKLVVIKRILPQFTRDRAFVDMLVHEARVAGTLNHPNICQTFDVGEVDGTYFIAMEHIAGEDVRSIVRAMKRVNQVEFPMEHALNIISGVCAGLGYAHDMRDIDGTPLEIVHRDISPQNVLVTFTGHVKVVDFGIAKSVEAAAGERTHSGQLKGKVPYMSPEQAAGHDIDHRSDIFSVGILLFELTTGRRLFKAASDYETLRLICERDYPRPSQVRSNYSPHLERIVLRALEKDRERRYQSARDMLADCEAFIREERIDASKTALAGWMKELFGDKIEASKENLQDLKQLADQVATQHAAEEAMYGATSTGRSTTSAATVATTEITPPKKSRVPLIAGVGGAVALAAVAFFALRGSSDGAGTATASSAPLANGAPTTASAETQKKAKLTINSSPAGCDVWLNGELQKATTPTTIELPFDREVEVKLTKKDHISFAQLITIKSGDADKIIAPVLDTGSVTLVLKVSPPPHIWLDGKPVTLNGDRLEGVSPGEHKLALSAVGFAAETITFTVAKGEVKTIERQLHKDPNASASAATNTPPEPPATSATVKPSGGTGALAVNAKGGYCNVSVNGRSYGPTPTVITDLPEGPAAVSCRTEDGKTLGSGAQIVAGKRASVTIQIPPK